MNNVRNYEEILDMRVKVTAMIDENVIKNLKPVKQN